MINIDDLIGIPYKLHGRNKEGYDCYGLAIEILKRMGYTLPDLYLGEESEKLNQVPCGDYSDIVLFYDSKGKVNHIGVCLDKNNFIHCDRYGVRVSKLSSVKVERRFFRWQS